MSWFNRKKNPYDTSTNDYLSSSDTVGRPLAVIFIILMVFVVAAAVFSLFLGGRWLYNNLDGKSTNTTTVITEQPATDTANSDSEQSSDPSTTGQSGGATSGGSSTTGNTTGSTPTSTTPTTPQPTPTMLPNTGPEPE